MHSKGVTAAGYRDDTKGGTRTGSQAVVRETQKEIARNITSVNYFFGTIRMEDENHGSEGNSWSKVGPPPRQDEHSGVVGVGALAIEAARCPEGVSIIHPSNCDCNPGFALISCQVFPLVPGARSLSSDVARSSIAGCGAQIPLLLLMWLSLAKTAGLRHRAVASLLAGGLPPPYRTIRKMQPYIITTCWARLAVDDTRHLGKLPR